MSEVPDCTILLTHRHISCIIVDIHDSLSFKEKKSAYAKPKAQISCAVTAQLISAFVFATGIVQFLFYLLPKFQASSVLLLLYRPVYVRPGRKFSLQFILRKITFLSYEPCHFSFLTMFDTNWLIQSQIKARSFKFQI